MPRAIMPSGRMIGLKEKTNSIHTALMRVLCIIISANINDIYNHYQAKTSLHWQTHEDSSLSRWLNEELLAVESVMRI